ncbi:MAG: DUF4139 domain-containing protein [Acidobacteriota bacterium]
MILRAPILAAVQALILSAAEPALTIYNQNFAVVREIVPLDLQAGVNRVQFTGATAALEPDSVVLRDPAGKRALRILEQSYRADPVSMNLLLSLYEGKTIEFLVRDGNEAKVVPGRIVRSGFAPIANQYNPYQPPSPYGGQAIVEMEGKLRFDLPGLPLFPALAADTILKPTLNWAIETDQPGKTQAELSYISGGMNWEADYNAVALDSSGALELVGWVTMSNQSGKTFENARIKLMAGDVNKIQPQPLARFQASAGIVGGVPGGVSPPVTEKAFDEYHLYTLERPATLHDRETKQVEFVRASGIASKIVYVYDGMKIDERYRGWGMDNIRNDPSYGTQSNTKVWVMRDFMNESKNHLGMPLPAGRVRFYRRDSDGRMEFTGEDRIEHTPRGERVRLFTGAAFDLAGERRRVNYRANQGPFADESFEIKVRNRKQEPVEIAVVEHLYRWTTWEIPVSSMPFAKKDAQTIEFKVPLQPGEEKTVSYTVHYSWW